MGRVSLFAALVLSAGASAAPPYLFRVVGSLDAGVGSPTAPLTLRRHYPDGGAAASGEPAMSVQLYAPAGADTLLFEDTPGGAPQRTLNIAGNSGSTPPFFLRFPNVGTYRVVADAGADAIAPIVFDVQVFALSHRQSFEHDAGVGLKASGEFHDEFLTGDARATIGYAGFAAHEGDGGYVFNFADPSTAGSGFAAHTLRYYLPRSGALHVRSWVRILAQNGQGEVNLFNLHAYGPTVSPVADLAIVFPSGRIDVGGHDLSSTYFYDAGTVTTDGGWFLAELAVTGMNTTAGEMRAYVNGQLSAALSPVDWSGMQYRDLTFGVPWVADKRFVGTILFDELAVTSTPPPTFVRASGPAVVSIGVCTQFLLFLTGTDGALTPAYRTHALGLQLVGNASANIFTDSNCTVPMGNPPPFTPGVLAIPFFIRANSAGTFTLTARTPDLILTDFVFSSGDGGMTDAGVDAGTAASDGGLVDDGGVDPDGGALTDAGASTDGGNEERGLDGGVFTEPAELAVSCGCQSTPPALLLVMLLTAIAQRRRP